MIGTQVGRYEILAEIGSGTLGMVYKAKDLESGEAVALKVLYCSDAEEAALKRFIRSVEATKILSHPNVLAPVDSGFIDEVTPYVVMSYCQGELLSDVLKREKYLDVPRTVAISAQVCDALEHAHYYGVIHRNLKPANIMLIKENGQEIAKVLDFGLAKSFFQGTKSGNFKVTVAGEVVGTPEFMSPEQCKFMEIDWRSDIYAMGCLIYMMLTGKPPIKGGSALETMMKQGVEEPLPFAQASNQIAVPVAVQEVIMRSLCKEKEERQQTMTQLRDEIAEASGLKHYLAVAEQSTVQPNKSVTEKRKPTLDRM
jgi:eukaryotic-like serine/threonine-protein kinase